jgi:hypothetical protein
MEWIIDDSTGERVKLHLDRRPLKELVGELVKNNFISVRLAYAIYKRTRHEHDIVNDTFNALDAP